MAPVCPCWQCTWWWGCRPRTGALLPGPCSPLCPLCVCNQHTQELLRIQGYKRERQTRHTHNTRRVHVDILLLLIKSSPTPSCMSGVWWSLVHPCSVLSPIITTWLRHNAQHSQQATSSHLFINTTIYCTVFTWVGGAVCPLEGFSFHGKTFNAPPNGLESVQITHFTFTVQIKPVFYVHCTV